MQSCISMFMAMQLIMQAVLDLASVSSCFYMLPVCSHFNLRGLNFCTFVCVGLCVIASYVFSGKEDSYTVTCGMPLPWLADTQKNNSGLYCLGEQKASTIYIFYYILHHKTELREKKLVFQLI